MKVENQIKVVRAINKALMAIQAGMFSMSISAKDGSALIADLTYMIDCATCGIGQGVVLFLDRFMRSEWIASFKDDSAQKWADEIRELCK